MASAETVKLMRNYQTLTPSGTSANGSICGPTTGVLEFPYAPAGRRRAYQGKADILAYVKQATGKVAADAVEQMRISPMLDPGMMVVELSIKGRARANDAPYNQSFIIFFEVQDGKLRRHREYWNPLITIDAIGDRDKWTAGFGFPKEPGA
ncbi:PhzA/PhzB family protein [Bradyrhizobium sp. dw_78]|uniref:nuclear transport factor 2 family protein n=1 Tax=Bradyrhizobium sp. dw_78 TaxID=2719793 RepID=UPI001BD5DC37|nr:PhzA/PhzB family protein [Bradyrhizobium sp. dw_78]